jgi:hypothetical protein
VQAEGEQAVFAKEPNAQGYLRAKTGYRLFEERDDLVQRLQEDVRSNREWLLESVRYPVAQ